RKVFALLLGRRYAEARAALRDLPDGQMTVRVERLVVNVMLEIPDSGPGEAVRELEVEFAANGSAALHLQAVAAYSLADRYDLAYPHLVRAIELEPSCRAYARSSQMPGLKSARNFSRIVE